MQFEPANGQLLHDHQGYPYVRVGRHGEMRDNFYILGWVKKRPVYTPLGYEYDDMSFFRMYMSAVFGTCEVQRNIFGNALVLL